MDELILQDKYLMNFFTNSRDGLGYKEVKANTVSKLHFIVEDLKHFISESSLNKKAYKTLLKKFDNNEKELLQEFQEFLNKRIGESMNMALFINNNKSVTFKGVKINLFYPSGSITQGDKLFDENVFSVVILNCSFVLFFESVLHDKNIKTPKMQIRVALFLKLVFIILPLLLILSLFDCLHLAIIFCCSTYY